MTRLTVLGTVTQSAHPPPGRGALFLGASGLGDIPLLPLVAAIVPFLLGVLVGNATAQVAASVLVTAILAPLLASSVLGRAGGLDPQQDPADPYLSPTDPVPAYGPASRSSDGRGGHL